MRFVVFESERMAAAYGAGAVAAVLEMKKDAVITLSAGEGMRSMYEELVRLREEDALDFRDVTMLGVGEYVGLSPQHNKSMRHFMDSNLFDGIGVERKNTFVPDGNPGNLEETLLEYDHLLSSHGGADIAVLEVGENGSLGFNEPAEVMETEPHVEFLSEETMEAHARFFGSLGEVPTEGVTMGMEGIFQSRSIVLMAIGESKAEVASALADSKVTTLIPATLLKLHPDVTVVFDRASAAGLRD
ncbi:MAG TPA: glucosamine-6-phosphate deaminase [Clostridiaceae bacterium]|nr:glucosamine-6-phosphate deaminase [Clostridiaceae bacterium]